MKRTSRIFLSLTLSLLLVFGLASCAKSEQTVIEPNEATIPTEDPAKQESQPLLEATDSLQRTVVLSSVPEEIVIGGKATMIAADALYLFPGARDSVKALGVTDQGLGDFFSLIAPGLSQDSRLSHSAGLEEIMALKPDLFITKSRNYDPLGEQLESLGVPVFTLELENPEDYSQEILQLGKLLGREERANEISEYYTGTLESITKVTDELSESDRPSVLLLYATSKDGISSYSVAPDSWIQTFMVEAAGGRAIWKGTNSTPGWMTVNIEQIAAWDPDRIYIVSYRSPATSFVEAIYSSELFSELSSTKKALVKPFPADYHSWAQPDTRWILGLQYLAWDLHPELYTDTDFSGILEGFYTGLYGVNDEAALEDIKTRYRASLEFQL